MDRKDDKNGEHGKNRKDENEMDEKDGENENIESNENNISVSMNELEKKLLIFYISNYEIEGEWNKNMFMSYIYAFFDPSTLDL